MNAKKQALQQYHRQVIKNLSGMRISELRELVTQFDAEMLCNLPESEFMTGGYFDAIAKNLGYSSGKSAANDLNLWQDDPVTAIRVLEGGL